jgi:copper chaperone CopZ
MRRAFALPCLLLSTLALTACGTTVSTAGFKGEQHEVAQTISNLQADATAAEQSKICADDLAASVVRKLGGTKGCEATIKSQLAQVDSLEVSVKSVQVATDASTATAQVKSIHEGKSRASAVSLVKEGGKWKVSGL